MKRIGVVGAGQMGGGIAQVFAQAEFQVRLFDSASPQIEAGIQAIGARLEKLITKGKLDAAKKDEILNRLSPAPNLTSFSDCDCVVEAVVENFDVKAKLFSELDAICNSHTILATNTSSISITKLAAATKRPDQVVGMHFMHPVPVMELVELIRGLQTSNKTYESILALAKSIGKTPITAAHDYPGFIVNRILVPMINEAIFALMEGLATVEEIDLSMKLGTNHPMGPLELADFVGLDTVLSILRILHEELGDDKYRPCPLLVKYVEAKWYGRKSGRGFYRYDR